MSALHKIGGVLPEPTIADDDAPSKVSSFTSNRELRELFPQADGGISVVQVLVLYGVLGGVSASAFICLSGVFGVGYNVFDFLMGLGSIWFFITGGALLAAIILHAVNCYKWSLRIKAPLGIMLFYIMLIGVACRAKKYPSAPFIVMFLQFPIVLALVRYQSAKRLRTSGSSFYAAAAACCFSLAAIVIAGWIAWIVTANMGWDAATRTRLWSHLDGAFERYNLRNWQECEDERSLSSGMDKEVLNRCSRIELTAFLIWACPLIEFVVLCTLGLFCVLRRLLDRGGSVPESILRMILFTTLLMCTAFWVVCSTAGASMGLSRVLMATLGIYGCCFAVWLLFVIDLESIIKRAKDTVIYKIIEPAMTHDYFVAMMFCFTQGIFVVVFILEFVVRQFERLFGIEGSGDPCLTVRGHQVAIAIRGKHWATTLEKAFNLCMLYLVLFMCSRFTPVFLSWLEEELKTTPFGKVCAIFYVVGLIMFLLPPVPGVPVYMAAGIIIVARGKQEPWLSFWPAIAFASALGLVLKLNAVFMQQKMIGEAFGRSVYIQHLVGVHTISIRAIEHILKRPGLTREKVAILCGGPDWPTSVLTGILRLSCPQMLLGTLPCIFLIVPCVLGGASLGEDDLKPLSPMMIFMVGATQGGVFLAALIYIAQETERNLKELSEPLPQHEALIRKCEEYAKESVHYKRATEWSSLWLSQKGLLVSAVSLEIMTCWVCFFAGGLCFRKFPMGNELRWDFEEGIVKGNALNMVKRPGVVVFCAIGCGQILFLMYTWITRLRLRAHLEMVNPAHG